MDPARDPVHGHDTGPPGHATSLPGKGIFAEDLPADSPIEVEIAASGADPTARWQDRRNLPGSNWPLPDPNPVFDVLHYDIDVTFNVDPKYVSGVVTLDVRWLDPAVSTLRLDVKELSILKATLEDGLELPFTQDETGVTVELPTAPLTEETVRVAVSYVGSPSRGFHTGQSTPHTFTEPNDSRYWFPCRDVPWDKATLTLHGRVAANMKLVSNGILEKEETTDDGRVFHWREDHPISTYLVSVAISSEFVAIEAQSDVVPMTWHVWSWDEQAARTAFQNVPAMMDFYDAHLHPYGFDKYDQVEAVFGGAMEHQSITLFGNQLIQGHPQWEWVHAHELAHHWFGNLVTLDNWREVWLNEGFATFYDAVWHEDFYGAESFAARMQVFETSVLNAEGSSASARHTIYDPPPSQHFGPLVYRKGAWVLRMLRDLMGREPFDAAIRDYLQTHAYGNATTGDLQAAMEGRHGEPLDWFFDQWIYYGIGSPTLEVVPRTEREGSGWRFSLTLTQLQSFPSSYYRFPLDLRIVLPSETIEVTEWVEAQRQNVFTYDVPEIPTGFAVDPENRMLGSSRISSTPSLATARPEPTELSAWPNPFRGSLQLALPPGATGVEVFDVRGRLVRRLPGHNDRVTWDGKNDAGRVTAPGIYFVRVDGSPHAVRVNRLR